MLLVILNKIKGYMARITVKNKETITTSCTLFSVLVEML